nr:hypothetical protein [Tanacetum cinerariifolium]
MKDLKQQYLDELKHLSNLKYRDEIKIAELTENFNGMSIEIQKKEKLLQQEQWAYLSTHPSKRLTSFWYDDDEDYTSGITPDEPVLSTEEPDNSLKDQFEDLSESNEEFSSTDDDSFSFDKIDYVEASPPDSELVSSEVMEIVIPKVGGIKESNDNPGTPPNLTPSKESDFFLEVNAFLAVDDEPTSSQFPKSYLDPEGDMLLVEAFLNDDHSSDFKTNDFLMKEIDLFCIPDYPMPSSIVDKDYDSKRDILISKDLPSNNTLSFAEKESFHFDIPLFSRPPAKPPDSDTGILNIKMMGDIFDQKDFMCKLMITLAPHQEKSPDLYLIGVELSRNSI